MTRLGDSKAVRKGGRYGRVMGTLWRHEKRDKCGRAAMGLLLDMWSWCADQSASVVSEKSMRKLFGGDPNGRRQLNELLAAGFVDRVEGGYAPHDWKDHSGFVKDLAEMEMKADLRCSRDEDVSGFVMKPGAEITEESTSPRACASPISQFSSSPIPEERESARAPIVPIQFVPVPQFETNQFSARAQRSAFVDAYEHCKRTAPSMGGREVDEFHGKVLRTAALQNRDPRELFCEVLAKWLSQPHNERERKHPYACFSSAWGDLTDKTEPAPMGPANANGRETVESLREQARNAVIAGDIEKVRKITARVAELQDAAERQNGGRRARA